MESGMSANQDDLPSILVAREQMNQSLCSVLEKSNNDEVEVKKFQNMKELE